MGGEVWARGEGKWLDEEKGAVTRVNQHACTRDINQPTNQPTNLD